MTEDIPIYGEPLAPDTPDGFRQARNHLNLSQARLAKLLGKSREQVSHWETGKHPIDGAAVFAMRCLLLMTREQQREVIGDR